MDSARVDLRRAAELDQSGEGFSFQVLERVRMISPEALETAQRALSEVHAGRTRPTPQVPQVGGAPAVGETGSVSP
jgi:hypothetical protein